MLKTRIISACVFVPIILVAVFLGGWVFAALMAMIAVIGGYEFGKMVEVNEYRFLPWIYYPAAIVLIALAQLMPKQPAFLLGALLLVFAVYMSFSSPVNMN